MLFLWSFPIPLLVSYLVVVSWMVVVSNVFRNNVKKLLECSDVNELSGICGTQPRTHTHTHTHTHVGYCHSTATVRLLWIVCLLKLILQCKQC